jgi:hypothetical protein
VPQNPIECARSGVSNTLLLERVPILAPDNNVYRLLDAETSSGQAEMV